MQCNAYFIVKEADDNEIHYLAYRQEDFVISDSNTPVIPLDACEGMGMSPDAAINDLDKKVVARLETELQAVKEASIDCQCDRCKVRVTRAGIRLHPRNDGCILVIQSHHESHSQEGLFLSVDEMIALQDHLGVMLDAVGAALKAKSREQGWLEEGK